ncbi:MAG: acetate--CoA ligase [Bacteroidetes bacterium RIFCSPLOWO2_02_FULL_36_8]|nr:MAG: acetate--CoA ligase [Bacteroidetes bacterium RIFCSPLOWO2_02_FULL_36_8]OFY70776.1 MAG: acetate--CoA ligase [Bacteroidetes bacterium RIFCSPLOWO2_12_FULL_37_12]
MMRKINSFEEYKKEYQQSVENPEKYWAEKAESFVWHKKWDKVLEWNFSEPEVKWFQGGKLNITENCLDRHLASQPDKTAILWEPNEPDAQTRTLTYRELHQEVCKFSNVLVKNGAGKGDRICIYMPMVPEAVVAILACARIGAIHSVVFAGFSAMSLSDRITDSTCKMVITSDGAYRGPKQIPIKDIVDEALVSCPSVKNVIVLKRTGQTIKWMPGRDLWWGDEMKNISSTNTAVEVDAEDPLFILYTSGSTGKPKGVLHTAGGYMVFAEMTFRNVFQYNPGDLHWCTADIGWVTGHTYIIYGPLLAGATSLVFEGIPTHPDPGRFWKVIDKHNVNIFYTAPTAIRALQSFGDKFTEPYSLNSLKVLGTVGEPINEEAWHWYNEKIGKKRCPITDTWWQTETGGILIAALAGLTKTKPSFATLPLPGIFPMIVDESGKELSGNDVTGNLCIKFPWPGMIRTTYGDHERCRKNYFSTYKNLYFTGDGCRRDEDGYYRITGRVDDVINVSGHRIGTAEVENAINQHENVVESAVVGFPHDIKGQGIYAYIICYKNPENEELLRKEIHQVVNKIIGPIAKPDVIQFVRGLPKTRSGKIMRRILRKVAEGDTTNLGDISTLLDPGVIEEIKKGAGELRVIALGLSS